jgi:guanine nucleotide-binding protein alpha-1 subunit
MEERASWRAVVQLNLVRNVTTILAVISAELDRQAASSSPASPSRGLVPLPIVDDDSDAGLPSIELSEKHKLLRLRLAPLKGLQRELEEKLGASSIESPYHGPIRDVYDDDDPHTAAAALVLRPGAVVDEGVTSKAYAAKMPQNDFFVRGTNGWKSALDKIGRTKKGSVSQSASEKERDEATELLVTCRDDMKALWTDQTVRDLLKRREVRMDDAPGLYVVSFYAHIPAPTHRPQFPQ